MDDGTLAHALTVLELPEKWTLPKAVRHYDRLREAVSPADPTVRRRLDDALAVLQQAFWRAHDEQAARENGTKQASAEGPHTPKNPTQAGRKAVAGGMSVAQRSKRPSARPGQ